MPECHKKYSITGNYKNEEQTDLQRSMTSNNSIPRILFYVERRNKIGVRILLVFSFSELSPSISTMLSRMVVGKLMFNFTYGNEDSVKAIIYISRYIPLWRIAWILQFCGITPPIAIKLITTISMLPLIAFMPSGCTAFSSTDRTVQLALFQCWVSDLIFLEIFFRKAGLKLMISKFFMWVLQYRFSVKFSVFHPNWVVFEINIWEAFPSFPWFTIENRSKY